MNWTPCFLLRGLVLTLHGRPTMKAAHAAHAAEVAASAPVVDFVGHGLLSVQDISVASDTRDGVDTGRARTKSGSKDARIGKSAAGSRSGGKVVAEVVQTAAKVAVAAVARAQTRAESGGNRGSENGTNVSDGSRWFAALEQQKLFQEWTFQGDLCSGLQSEAGVPFPTPTDIPLSWCQPVQMVCAFHSKRTKSDLPLSLLTVCNHTVIHVLACKHPFTRSWL